MSGNHAEALAYRYIELLNKGDFDALAELFTDDAKIWIAGDNFTKDSFRALAKGVFQKMYAKGPHMEPINCFASGNRSVIEVNTTGTSMTGNAYVNRYCLVFQVEDDKAVSMSEYLDSYVARKAHGRFSPDE